MANEGYNKYGFFPARDEEVNNWWEIPVATGQTLHKGDPVIISGGQIAVAVSNSSAELAGVIAQDADSLTAGTLVKVWANPDTIFKARASATCASAAVGTGYDLTGSTGTFQFNPAATSQGLFQYLGTFPGQTNSTEGVQVTCKILKHTFADTST